MATVLVVDDDESIRNILEKFLVRQGHRVIIARGGTEALEKMAERPDIVLLDIMMPDLHGLKVLDRIREMNQSAEVIMMTGLDEHAVGVESLKRGACEFITKPISLNHLGTVIDMRLLNKSLEIKLAKEAPWIPKEPD